MAPRKITIPYAAARGGSAVRGSLDDGQRRIVRPPSCRIPRADHGNFDVQTVDPTLEVSLGCASIETVGIANDLERTRPHSHGLSDEGVAALSQLGHGIEYQAAVGFCLPETELSIQASGQALQRR